MSSSFVWELESVVSDMKRLACERERSSFVSELRATADGMKLMAYERGVQMKRVGEISRLVRLKNSGLLLTSMALEVKQVEINGEDGSFEAYGSTFGGPPDRQGDTIRHGAFAQSIRELNGVGVPLLWQHDTTEPLGRALELREDSRGLWFKGIIRKSARRGAEALDLLRHRVVDSFSIGYMIREGGSRMVGGVRELTNVELLELSIATIPANPRAQLI